MARFRIIFLLPLFLIFGVTTGDVGDSNSDEVYFLKNQCLESLQKQINDELYASLTYLNMAAHFHHGSIARKGFFRFFEHESDEEIKHARKLIYYINKRGGRVGSFDISMPIKSSWSSAEEAVKDAVALEKELNVKLHVIHKTADRICTDPHLMDFLETEYLEEQMQSISKLNKLLSNLNSFENKATGEYLVDQQLVEEKGRRYYEDEL